jgi:hypothetical protein
MLRRPRSGLNSNGGGDGLPMAHGGGGAGGYSSYSSSGSGGYGGYGGYNSKSNSGGGGNIYSGRSSSGRGNSLTGMLSLPQFPTSTLSILKLLIGLTLLWSAVIGFWYWNLRSSLSTVLSSIPEANPLNSKILRNIPTVIDDYLQDLQSKVESAERQVSVKQRAQQRKFQQELNEIERDNRFLQKERDELRVKYEGPDKVEELARLQGRELAFQEQVDLLQEATRKESKRTVLERYAMFLIYIILYYIPSFCVPF